MGVFDTLLVRDDTPAVAPAPNAKFALFAQPVETCDHLGLLSDAARPYRSRSPYVSEDPGAVRRAQSALIAVPILGVLILAAALLLRWRDRPWL